MDKVQASCELNPKPICRALPDGADNHLVEALEGEGTLVTRSHPMSPLQWCEDPLGTRQPQFMRETTPVHFHRHIAGRVEEARLPPRDTPTTTLPTPHTPPTHQIIPPSLYSHKIGGNLHPLSLALQSRTAGKIPSLTTATLESTREHSGNRKVR